MASVRAVAPSLLLLGACYTELGVGYYPSLRETVSPPGEPVRVTESAGLSASTWFVGGTLSTRVARGTLLQLSVGLQRQRLTAEATSGSDGTVVPTELAATGAALRFMFTWTPTGAFLRYYQPGAAATPAAGGGCYYAERCDADGKCRSVYTCP